MDPAPLPSTGPRRSMTSASLLLRMRSDHAGDPGLAYWRGTHAQRVARMSRLHEYRQHHFSDDGNSVRPVIEGVETAIPPGQRVDGMDELIFAGRWPSARPTRRGLVPEDEATAFAHAVLCRTRPGAAHWFGTRTEGEATARAVLLVRRRPDRPPRLLADAVHRVAAALASVTGVLEVRTQVFAPLPGPATAAGSEGDAPGIPAFHAAVIVGARDRAALDALMTGERVPALGPALREAAVAVHVYPVATTLVLRLDGRPTLPRLNPELMPDPRRRVRKPRLDPVLRSVPAAPPASAPTLPPHAGRLLALPAGGRPEDVVVAADGSLLAGLHGGPVVRIDPVTERVETVADTRGRPLGLEALPDGRVLVCDAHRGLLRADPATGALETLVQYVDGVPLRFCSNAAAQPDGTIWFTESSSRYDFEHYEGAFIEHRPSGRLFRRDPQGTVEVVLSDLHFANGVALTPDGSGLLFVETGGYRVSRLRLAGPEQGRVEVLADNLPGFPDNLSSFRDGRAWLALTNPRLPLLDRLAGSPPLVRKLLWRVPDRLQPEPVPTVWALALDPDGGVVDEAHADRPDFRMATGVAEHGGRLYLASPVTHDLLVLRR